MSPVRHPGGQPQVVRIRIATSTTRALRSEIRGQCVVRNNHVHHVGQIYPAGLLFGGRRDGQTCHIEHNTVHGHAVHGNRMRRDDHRIETTGLPAMQVLHDGAGIYITFCKRIVLRGITIHDIIDTGGYGASAYYLDDRPRTAGRRQLSVRVRDVAQPHGKKNTLRKRLRVRRDAS